MEITDDAVKHWLGEIDHAKKRDGDYLKDGKTIRAIYDGEEIKAFNILYSNTETLVPALYSQTPRPVVKRRFAAKEGAEPLMRAVEMASERMLAYLIDTNMPDYESFDESMKNAVIDAALPGRGLTQVKFDADLSDDEVKRPIVCTDTHQWNRAYFGQASKWSRVPWIALEWYLDEEEAESIFGEDIANLLEYTDVEKDDEDNEYKTADAEDSRKAACCFQIFDKNEKQIVWVSEQVDQVLKTDEDPLKVGGFFPFPRPLTLHSQSNSMKVTPLYKLYEEQAKELNRIQIRLNKVIEAIKVRGAYDGAIGSELSKIMDEEDNALVASENTALLAEGDFSKRIWFLPIAELIAVAQNLQQARESCKQVIYEITGISDIMRGTSKASETLGAQKIKQGWGTLRLKGMQAEVQRYVRDTLRIMLDVAVSSLPMDTWRTVTGLPIPTKEEKEMAIAEVASANVGAPSEGQEKGPPAATIAMSESPTWEDVLEALQDDYIRSYKIDIETNSTLEVEATDDKQQVMEFMNAFAQFTNGTAPMVERGFLTFGSFKTMTLAIAQKYRFGREVEEELKAMTEPKTDPRMAKMQQELQKKQETFDSERERVGNELDARVRKLEMDSMQFDYDKKLFEKQMAFDKKLMEKQQQVMESELEATFMNALEDSKREMRSNVDRLISKVMEAVKKTEVE